MSIQFKYVVHETIMTEPGQTQAVEYNVSQTET